MQIVSFKGKEKRRRRREEDGVEIKQNGDSSFFSISSCYICCYLIDSIYCLNMRRTWIGEQVALQSAIAPPMSGHIGPDEWHFTTPSPSFLSHVPYICHPMNNCFSQESSINRVSAWTRCCLLLWKWTECSRWKLDRCLFQVTRKSVIWIILHGSRYLFLFKIKISKNYFLIAK